MDPHLNLRLRRRFGLPFALGLLGVVALGLSLLGPLRSLPWPPALADQPAPVLLALALANPLVLLATASLLGALLAHRVGLGSWVVGTSPYPGRVAWLRALAWGLGLALLLMLLDAGLLPRAGAAGQLLQGTVDAPHLLVGVLYGGLTEEVMLRWGLLSLIAWALLRLLRPRQPHTRATLLWTANLLAALIFALGHLPALAALVEPTPWLVARTLALNGIAGLVYGALYLRHSLEMAMAAHAATHLGFWLLAPLLSMAL